MNGKHELSTYDIQQYRMRANEENVVRCLLGHDLHRSVFPHKCF